MQQRMKDVVERIDELKAHHRRLCDAIGVVDAYRQLLTTGIYDSLAARFKKHNPEAKTAPWEFVFTIGRKRYKSHRLGYSDVPPILQSLESEDDLDNFIVEYPLSMRAPSDRQIDEGVQTEIGKTEQLVKRRKPKATQ